VLHTASSLRHYKYKSDYATKEMIIEEMADKIVLIKTYPFWWIILVLFWTYMDIDVKEDSVKETKRTLSIPRSR